MEEPSPSSRLRIVRDVADYTAVQVAVITCSSDGAAVRALIADHNSSSKKSSPMSLHVVETDVADVSDLNSVASTIAEVDIVIIVLSINFVQAVNAFQTLIYTIRTMRKPFRFFNLMSSYLELANNPIYKSSNVSMLVSGAIIYSSWNLMLEGWAMRFKTTALTAKQETSDVLPPLDDWNYICCFDESSRVIVRDILDSLQPYQFREQTAALTGDQLKSPLCAVLFVTHALVTDNKYREAILSTIERKIPLVIAVINDKSDSNWLKSGLGIMLANELWVDFRTRPYYVPGEHVPSFGSMLRDLSIRLRNSCLKGSVVGSPSASRAVQPSKLKVYFCHSWSDSDFATMGQEWPLPADLKRTYKKEHDTVRYADVVSRLSHVRLDFDMSYEHEPGDYFESCCSFFTAANVVVQMWSTRYITSFYPYTEIFQSFVWQHKTVIVVFLDPIEEILRALETMPQFEIIYEKIFMLRGCFLKTGHVQWGKFYGISSVGRTFDETKSDLVYLLQSEDIISGGRCEVIHTPIRADGLTAGFDIFLSYCWRNSSSAATAGDISNYIGLTDPRDLKRDIERETHLRCWLDIEQLGCDGLFEGLHRALSNTSLSLVVLCLSDEYAASPNCAMELQYAIRRIPCIVVCVGDGEGWRKTPTGLFSAFQESFDLCKNPYPQSEQGQAIFNRLVMRIRAICRLKQGVSHAVALR